MVHSYVGGGWDYVPPCPYSFATLTPGSSRTTVLIIKNKHKFYIAVIVLAKKQGDYNSTFRSVCSDRPQENTDRNVEL